MRGIEEMGCFSYGGEVGGGRGGGEGILVACRAPRGDFGVWVGERVLPLQAFEDRGERQGSQPAMGGEWAGGGGGAMVTGISSIGRSYFVGSCLDLVAMIANGILG